MRDDRERVEHDPENDDDALADDVLRRPEEASDTLRATAEGVLAECTVVLGSHGPRVERTTDSGAMIPA